MWGVALQPGRLPESGIFVSAASDSAPDNFTVNYFPGGRFGGAVRMSCPSRRLAAIRFCGGYLVRVSRWGNPIL